MNTGKKTMRFDGKEFGVVEITIDNLPLQVKKATGQEVVFELEVKLPEDSLQSEEVACNQILNATYDEDSQTVKAKIETPPFRIRKCNITAYVPENTKLKLESENGPVSVSDLISDIDISLENGPLKMKRCTGDMTIKLENGPVKMSEISGLINLSLENGPGKILECSGELILDSENSPLKIEDCSFDKIIYRNENGLLRYNIPTGQAEGDYRFETENGKLVIEIGKEVEYDLTARTDGGVLHVTLDGDYEMDRDNGSKILQKKVGSGSVKINVKSENGAIYLLGEHSGTKRIFIREHGEGGTDSGEFTINIGATVKKAMKAAIKGLENAKEHLNEDQLNSVKDKIDSAQKRMKKSMKVHLDDTDLVLNLSGLSDDIQEGMSDIGSDIRNAVHDVMINFKKKSQRSHRPERPHVVHRRSERKRHREDEGDNLENRKSILKMLEDGKLSVEEALKLLNAVKE
ncbi:MAG: hypothetical protein K8S56_10590 [Candidatus Cloacimonetes bacterium]|nr:hypothetical protein [Candidatus Cloacimonadota bacterium]